MRRAALVELSFDNLVRLLQTRVVLPEGSVITGATWDWSRQVLRVRVEGDQFPEVSDGVEPPSLYLTETNIDGGKHGIWWWEAET